MFKNPSETRCKTAIYQGKSVVAIPYELIAETLSILEEAEADQPGVTTEFIKDTLEGATQLTEEARKIGLNLGCHAQYLLGEQAVKVICDYKKCPFYPNGPETSL